MQLNYNGPSNKTLYWRGSPRAIAFDPGEMHKKLAQTDRPCFIIQDFSGRIGVSSEGEIGSERKGLKLLAMVEALPPEQLGDDTFCRDYSIRFAYKTGAMANGIASTDLVLAIGRAGLLASFGAAGLVPSRVKAAIETIQEGLPDKSYAFNLIHSPNEEALEEGAVSLYLSYGVRIVEASAYLSLTPHIVHYRAAGLSHDANGKIVIANKVIAKISRKEVATHFLKPPPEKMLDQLVKEGKITAHQAQLAAKVPMADDITVEADSGGHTDNRPLVALLPIIIRLRDEIQSQYQYAKKIRVGAAGGISTPESALAAFMMGAAYVVTGSVNQACTEAGSSEHVKKLLATAASTDVIMAPASDMFEMGVELQVLKRGTLFGPRAKKLYEYYTRYKSIDEIPAEERTNLEEKIFRQPLESIWQACIDFFQNRDPKQIERAQNNPHRKMALIFRWYLGLSSNWANAGTPDRKQDYQIWCGPAMGAFNDWVKGSFLEQPRHRQVAIVADNIMKGAAYLYRIQSLKMQGVSLPLEWEKFKPERKLEGISVGS